MSDDKKIKELFPGAMKDMTPEEMQEQMLKELTKFKESISYVAIARRIAYNAYIQAGFTPEQAIHLVTLENFG